MCKDPGLTYLNDLGYNVVRYPRADILPMDVLGRQRGTLNRLGTLTQLLHEGDSSMPRLIRDVPAVAIESRRSSRIETQAALSILRPYLSAMGAAPGASAQFRRCRGMEFVFTDVHIDQVMPAEIGAVLGRHAIDAANPVWRPYLEDEGELFILIETLKSQKLTLSIESESRSGASLDTGALQAAVGAQVSVSVTGERASTLHFAGRESLVFGFKCLQLRFRSGHLSLQAATPDADLAFAVGDRAEPRPVLAESGVAPPVLFGNQLLRVSAPTPAGRARRASGATRSQTVARVLSEVAPVPEEDSPRMGSEHETAVLYLRLLGGQREPLAQRRVQVRGPLPSPGCPAPTRPEAGSEGTLRTICQSDPDGIVWLEGLARGAYAIEVDGVAGLVHSLSSSDLQTDSQPYTAVFAKKE
jgi:hypothetical protein